RRGVGGFVAMTLALMLVVMLGDPGLYVIIAGLLLANACLGVVIPTVMVVALDEHGDIAGLASSLGGTLQMLTGGAAVALAGPFFNGTAAPMVVAIALSALAAGVLTVAVLRQGVEPEATV
ncbi:MAG: Bcr/CflA family drug resistance efflux transporter, partial [Maritimibacter sp.]